MSDLERLREKLELARDDYNQCGGGVDDRISDRFIKHADALIAALEEEVALRDRMLTDIIERIALTPERWSGWTTQEVLADLRARAEEAR